jgi:hypothetical protein
MEESVSQSARVAKLVGLLGIIVGVLSQHLCSGPHLLGLLVQPLYVAILLCLHVFFHYCVTTCK